MSELSWHELKSPDEGPKTQGPLAIDHGLERFEASMTALAVGDALGWPHEGSRHPNHASDSETFHRWSKLVGGRWWGYRDTIESGEYSDDTQLTIAIARCIGRDGDLDVEQFAYEELPLWLQYERGGGRAIKAAARSMLRPDVAWNTNFYSGPVRYRSAGANGAAMRSLPVALVSFNNQPRLIRDTFRHSITTHGHPRAILGAVVIAMAYAYALGSERLADLPDAMAAGLPNAALHLRGLPEAETWASRWDAESEHSFSDALKAVVDEIQGYLRLASEGGPIASYYQSVGALDPKTRGSGAASVCAAIFLASKEDSSPAETVQQAALMTGSDTDTIAGMVGALLGARYGWAAVPDELAERVQDAPYLRRVASDLYSVAFQRTLDAVRLRERGSKIESLRRIWAWEIGLHQMFWEALEAGRHVEHPTLGGGTIESRRVERISRDGYEAQLVRVRFDTGQTCVFHSRVNKKTGNLGESLTTSIEAKLL